MVKRGVEDAVFKLIKDSKNPLSTRKIALQLDLAWHTVDRHCLKLQLQNKIGSFTIGKATAWYKK